MNCLYFSNKSNKVQKEEPFYPSFGFIFARIDRLMEQLETLAFFASAFHSSKSREKFSIYFRRTRRNKAKLTIIYVDKTFSLQNMRFQFALNGGLWRVEFYYSNFSMLINTSGKTFHPQTTHPNTICLFSADSKTNRFACLFICWKINLIVYYCCLFISLASHHFPEQFD